MSDANTSIVRLAPAKWRDKIAAAADLRRAKSEADKAAREADSLWRQAKAEIIGALNGAPGATCGGAIITVKETASSEATITLSDGSVVKWADVHSVTIGNKQVAAKDVAKLYGGRSQSEDVAFAGV